MCHFIDLIQYNDLPEWYQDNNLITEGYRAPNPNYSELINSIFSLHNETANIWSHIAGVVLFIVLAIYYGTIGNT
jgi:adiponectin receptor